MRDFFGGGGDRSENDGDDGGENSGETEHSHRTCGLGQTRSLLLSEQYSLILSQRYHLLLLLNPLGVTTSGKSLADSFHDCFNNLMCFVSVSLLKCFTFTSLCHSQWM